MVVDKAASQKMILDLEKVNTLNAEGCAACGRKFSLGDMVVLACGAWEGEPKWIHENEAIYDPRAAGYVERKCFSASRGR